MRFLHLSYCCNIQKYLNKWMVDKKTNIIVREICHNNVYSCIFNIVLGHGGTQGFRGTPLEKHWVEVFSRVKNVHG
jgi:hypothetical protein